MNNIATLIYKAILTAESKLIRFILLKIRSMILKVYNPIINITFNGVNLDMPFSHTIFYFQKIYPNYDIHLHKIAKYIKEQQGYLNMIDVGANIGDTVVFTNIHGANYLLIEGEKSYIKLIDNNLIANYKQIENITNGGGIYDKNSTTYIIENTFLSDDVGYYKINLDNGSGKLEHSDYKNTLPLNTLDIIVKKHKFKANFIKIDTDGFDFKVIRSGINIIKDNLPVLYFEWDKFHLESQNENPISIFKLLNKLGYEDGAIFDNFGNLLCSIKTYDENNLKILIGYTEVSKKNIYYYDVLLFNKNSNLDIKDCITKIYN